MSKKRHACRSISRRVSKVEGGVHEHEKASKRRASVQAMRPAAERRDAAPPPDVTRDKVGYMARPAMVPGVSLPIGSHDV
jgi:hypothetical protein